MEIKLSTTITCPQCNHSEDEEMSLNSCLWFYECKNCKTLLKPKPGDCCVYCSYGSVKCPPVQLAGKCC